MNRRRIVAVIASFAIIAAAAGCTSSSTNSSTNSSTSASLAGGSSAAATAPSSGDSSAGAPVAVPTLTWSSCPAAEQGGASVQGFECATAVVPMDYAQPGGDTFSLAVIKYPAQDQANRIGTLFWNPGGPSDAGTQYLPVAIQGFPEKVRNRFDIVSWDPRGMGGRTTPVVQCFDSAEQEAAFNSQQQGPAIPVSKEELAAFTANRTAFNEKCIQHNGDLLAHVSTADNARDLDLLRQAVGEDRMNYYGTSYGTFLGATYANMFPDRVRAAVLDGAVFPTAWSDADGDLSTFLRIGSDIGAVATVKEFMNQCGAVDAASCAFSAGSPAATQDKWAQLLEKTKGGLAFQGGTIDDRAVQSYVQSVHLHSEASSRLRSFPRLGRGRPIPGGIVAEHAGGAVR